MFQRITQATARWLTLAAQRLQGRPQLEEVIVSQVMQGRLRFAQYVDPREGETPAMRNSYRSLCKEPTVKSCLDTIVGGVASSELEVPPVNKGNPRDVEIAEFCRDLMREVDGGMIGVATAIIGNGCVEGYSICERKWKQIKTGRWKGKQMIEAVKPKPTDLYWFEVDQFWNVTGVVSRMNPNTVHPTEDFIFWRHQNYSISPHGTSLMRACYRSAWMLDTVWKLRGIGLERYTLPVLVGKYPMNDDPVKASMEAAIRRLKANGYAMIPSEAAIEPMQLAQRGTADFEAAVKDLKEEICVGMIGASLQTLQGFTPGGRGSSAVHQGVVDTRIWMYANALREVIARQIFAPAVWANYGPDTEVPWPVLGGLNDDEVKKSLDLDEQMQRMGYPVSLTAISERTRRTPATSDADTLKPPSQAQPGIPGMPGGGLGGLLSPPGGQDGPGSQGPNNPPPPPAPGPSTPAAPFSERAAKPTEPTTPHPAVVVINQHPEQFRAFSAADWQRGEGPRGGHYWQNVRTGEKVYQQDNPGGSGDTPAAQPATPEPERSTPQETATAPQTPHAPGGAEPAAPVRNRLRERPEAWGQPIIPGIAPRQGDDGQAIWNIATSTGYPRARPIIEDIRRLFANPAAITEADYERVRAAIAGTRGRDALYTLAVGLGVDGGNGERVARGAIAAMRATPGGQPTPAPAQPQATPPVSAPVTPPTPTPAAQTPPAAPAARRPTPEEKKFKATSPVKATMSDTDKRDAAQVMARIIPDFKNLTDGHDIEAVMSSLVGAPAGTRVSVQVPSRTGDQVYITVSGNGYSMTRYIGKGEDGPYIKNSYFRNENRGEGSGTEIFANQVEAAASLGIKKIKTHAAGPPSFNGYYTWPRFGYDQPLSDTGGIDRDVRERVMRKFPNARTIQDVMKTKEGRDWWRDNGSDLYNMTFDLSPDSKSMKVLKAYQAERAARPPGTPRQQRQRPEPTATPARRATSTTTPRTDPHRSTPKDRQRHRDADWTINAARFNALSGPQQNDVRYRLSDALMAGEVPMPAAGQAITGGTVVGSSRTSEGRPRFSIRRNGREETGLPIAELVMAGWRPPLS